MAGLELSSRCAVAGGVQVDELKRIRTIRWPGVDGLSVIDAGDWVCC
jgi:hypothetical protein